MKINTVANVTAVDFIGRDFGHMSTHYDRKYECAWCYMHPEPRQCFTPGLLSSLNDWFASLRNTADQLGIKYHVITAKADDVFNLGGDLDLFRRLSATGDRDSLMAYAIACIDALHANLTGFNQDITTISLVKGSALGGGFEAALSSDVLIAEKNARMGFPEVLFNLFPGMGAYSFLSRKLGPKQAERMILSGKIYDAVELYDMGLIDVLANSGEGETAVHDYIKRENRSRNGFRALRKVRDYCDSVSYEELKRVVEIWVDAAMNLTPRDLRMMEKLVKRQDTVPQ